jgi:hypothetical protein
LVFRFIKLPQRAFTFLRGFHPIIELREHLLCQVSYGEPFDFSGRTTSPSVVEWAGTGEFTTGSEKREEFSRETSEIELDVNVTTPITRRVISTHRSAPIRINPATDTGFRTNTRFCMLDWPDIRTYGMQDPLRGSAAVPSA